MKTGSYIRFLMVVLFLAGWTSQTLAHVCPEAMGPEINEASHHGGHSNHNFTPCADCQNKNNCVSDAITCFEAGRGMDFKAVEFRPNLQETPTHVQQVHYAKPSSVLKAGRSFSSPEIFNDAYTLNSLHIRIQV